MKSRIMAFIVVCAVAALLPACKGGGKNAAAAQYKGTLRIFIPGISNLVSSFDSRDNSFTKKLEDETGIKLEFDATSNADFPEKFNVMMSTGDYPDIVMTGYQRSFSRNDLDYYGSQGIFRVLDEAELMTYPNIKQLFEDHAGITHKLRGADGTIYARADVNDCLHCTHAQGRGYYYMPFLRDSYLKGKVPETQEEFVNYLRYIRDNDVNGNGDPHDEIPLVTNKNYLNTMVAFAAKQYMPYLKYTHNGLAVRDGKVWEQYRDNEFRQALIWLNSLYREDLIAPQSFTMTTEEIQALGSATDPIVAVHLCDWQGEVIPNGSDRFPYYFHLYPLTGPRGERWGFNGPNESILNARVVITDKCEDPKLAFELYNAMLKFDNMLMGYSGPRGVFYTDPDSGAKSLGGGTPAYKLLIPFASQPVNTSWNQNNPMNRTLEFRVAEQATDVDTVYRWFETGEESLYPKMLENKSYNELQWIYFTANRSVPWAVPEDLFIPSLAMNEDDGNRIQDIRAQLEPYKEKAYAEFITGVRNINSSADWNTYLAELDRLESRAMVEIFNKYL
jgi:putative aldouronate transport system substrate-binding protein